jgi:aryl-alcohol dehydrogenase-like predicted oxidoreductase
VTNGHRRIGSLEVTLPGFGCGVLGDMVVGEAAKATIEAALEAGVGVFDTADVYADGLSEQVLAGILGSRRDQVVITSKFGGKDARDATLHRGLGESGPRPGSAAYIREACEGSLVRLQTDYIDVYLMHYPDPDTPLEETLTALGELHSEGKVREIGGSNFTPEEIREVKAVADRLGVRSFTAMQSSYSLLDRTAEQGLLPACEELGIGFQPYFPLAMGMLTGKHRRGTAVDSTTRLAADGFHDLCPDLRSEECFDVVEALEAYAAARDHTLVELALSWMATRPAVATVIAGASTPKHVRANTAALTAWPMTADEIAEIDRITERTVKVAFTRHRKSPAYAAAPGGGASTDQGGNTQ